MSETSSSSSSNPGACFSCYMCHQGTRNPNQIQLCDNCTLKLKQQTNADNSYSSIEPENFKRLVPSTSIEEMSVAISRSSSDFNDFNIKNRHQKHELKNYYHSVNEWINVMDELNQPPDYEDDFEDKNEANFCIRCATYCSFGLNLMLLVGKALAMSTSASYTIMSSLADSCLDIIAGIIISCTAANSKTTDEDRLKYPVGKSRISTVGILVFSVLMSCCAIFIILQCTHSLLNHENAPPTTSTAMFIMVMTITVKFCMWIVYNYLGHPITVTLAEDHRNDVFTNSFGLFMYWGGGHFAWWMDSTGGLLLSLFVLNSWARNALENATMLIGIMAPPDIIRNVTYVSAHHHPLIKSVSKVVAYQIGPSYFAEVHIVVDNKINPEAAFWVADSLAKRLERVEDIEHAYVHLETTNHDRKLQDMLSSFNPTQDKLFKADSLSPLAEL
ncbi:Metal tolerance protein 4 [Tritrichomonas foetus]|uniref:Metal tolerance protein 4 n=1 Tax=Tritrichomonas foetus TaxID=1144522 RepID=A0A1J4KJS9_9EUKA|nr:Metal tolerance protein 4 [Tritrichomonas foetus]|eukprot:OHT11200.1 Metal tolerance protein 4 [Tritrichomonas foetus]